MNRMYAPACSCPDWEYHEDDCEVWEPEHAPAPSGWLFVAILLWVFAMGMIIASV